MLEVPIFSDIKIDLFLCLKYIIFYILQKYIFLNLVPNKFSTVLSIVYI